MENFINLYPDYLISSTSSGMAGLLSINHDKITKELSCGNYDSKYLWKKVKPYVHKLARSAESGVLNFDDSIEEKSYTDESELVCWHWKHVFS